VESCSYAERSGDEDARDAGRSAVLMINHDPETLAIPCASKVLG